MKKTIIALAAVLATAFGASALEYEHSVMVNRLDGTSVEYKFADTPVAYIDGENLKMTVTTTGESVLYPFTEVKNLTFKAEKSGITNVGAEAAGPSFGLTDDTLEAGGLGAGVKVCVYDVAGALRVQGECGPDGTVSLDISMLGKGVYVVNAGKHSFKFIR